MLFYKSKAAFMRVFCAEPRVSTSALLKRRGSQVRISFLTKASFAIASAVKGQTARRTATKLFAVTIFIGAIMGIQGSATSKIYFK